MKLEWTKQALQQVLDMADYIRGDRPSVAEAWGMGLFDRVESLSQFPLQGRVVPEVGRHDIRELHYPPCRVIYRVETNKLRILAVRHTRRKFGLGEPGE